MYKLNEYNEKTEKMRYIVDKEEPWFSIPIKYIVGNILSTCVQRKIFSKFHRDDEKNVSLNDWTAQNGVSVINFLDMLLYTNFVM